MDTTKTIAIAVRQPNGKAAQRRAAQAGLTTSKVSPARLVSVTNSTKASLIPTHRFAVGARLNMLDGGRQAGRTAGACIVLRLLPYEGHELQYRVRSEAESYERVVAEHHLTEFDAV
jgi:hypothetical protein